MKALTDWRTLVSTSQGLALWLDSRPAVRVGRLFEKDVARVGEWEHPATGQTVTFSRTDLEEIAENTNRWITALQKGVRGPRFHDGVHITRKPPKADDNLAEWLSFRVDGDRLVGLVEPGDDEVADLLGGRMRYCSMCVVPVEKDSHGNEFRNVIEHVAFTPEPVIEGLGNFVALSHDRANGGPMPLFTLKETPPMLKKIIAALALSADTTEEAAIAAVEKLKATPAPAPAAPAQDVVALSTRAAAAESQVTALSAKVAALETERSARETAECEAACVEVKALAASAGRPEAFGADREKRVKDLWGKDRETAREILALAREASGAPAHGIAEGKVARPPAGAEVETKAKKEAVTQIVTALARNGTEAEVSADGLSYRTKGAPGWSSL